MESSKLKIESRNKLYFNKFKYRAVCNILGAGYTYYVTDLDNFKTRLEKLKSNKNRYAIRIMDNDYEEHLDQIDIEQISKFLAWRNTVSKSKFMYRIQGDNVSFFSNDLDLLKTLKSINENIYFTEAKVLDHDKLYFKRDPVYKYRTFFKGKRIPEDFLANVLEFRERYGSTTKISQSLINLAYERHKVYSKYIYLHGSYHIDYNDESMVTILHMLFSDMIGKTYICVKE